MSKRDSKRLKATFRGEEVRVTLEQQVMSTALAIEALERLLIKRGLLTAGDLERAVNELIEEKQAPIKRIIELVQ